VHLLDFLFPSFSRTFGIENGWIFSRNESPSSSSGTLLLENVLNRRNTRFPQKTMLCTFHRIASSVQAHGAGQRKSWPGRRRAPRDPAGPTTLAGLFSSSSVCCCHLGDLDFIASISLFRRKCHKSLGFAGCQAVFLVKLTCRDLGIRQYLGKILVS